MTAEDDLRLAWLAHREGRAGRRDALLTLAVAEGEPKGLPWVEPIRAFLVAEHPGHLFAGFYHLDEALGDRRVAAQLKKLRLSFPPARVRNLLALGEAARGPFPPRRGSLRAILDDILAPTRSRPRGASRTDSKTASTEPDEPEPGSVLAFYLQVLLNIAALCALVVDDSSGGKKAA